MILKNNKIPNISFTKKYNLCTGCGVCVSACPHSAITMEVVSGCFLPQIDSTKCLNKKGCHRCMDACPGIGCNVIQIGKEVLSDALFEDWICGRYTQCYVGHSTDNDIRYHCASGGMLSQMLIWLLETKRIDGAVVTAFDNSNPFMVRSYLATTREEILQGKGSKYAPVTLDIAAREIKRAQGSHYVIVGIPCHIQGFRKLAKIDKKFREKISAYFGIYCSSGRTFNLTEYVFKERNIEQKKLTYFAYRDEGCLGSMVVKQSDKKKYKERYQNYYHPLRSFFIPKRCLFCVDHYAELSDISFGDIHVEPYLYDTIGINSIVARTPKMIEWLEKAKIDGVITLDKISIDVLNDSQKMASKKMKRVATFMKVAKCLGNKVPIYDITFKHSKSIKSIIDYLQIRCQQTIGLHKYLWPLISVLKSKSPQK